MTIIVLTLGIASACDPDVTEHEAPDCQGGLPTPDRSKVGLVEKVGTRTDLGMMFGNNAGAIQYRRGRP